MHRAAIQIERSGGGFPSTREGLEALPGVGRSTAAAVLALAYGKRAAILDGNVKRVLSRFHAVEGDVSRTATLNALWEHAESHTPRRRVRDYTQAIMDLGATVCVRQAPKCDSCPVAGRCEAFRVGRAEEFPQRRRMRAKPVRRARMYVIVAPTGACLLERRVADGVWGGLWTPPQRAADCTPVEMCRDIGIDEQTATKNRTGPVFRHTFSHFHLDIQPVYVMLDETPGQVLDGDRTRWYHPGGSEPVGMPAPAVRLLKGVFDSAAN